MAGVIAFALACGLAVEADLLAAIVSVESGGNPLAIQVNGPMELVRQPRGRGEAVAMASWLLAHGYNFDAGLAQMNSANFARLGLDAESVFELCPNLHGAATILAECLERARVRGLLGESAVTAALSCYNTGHLTRGVQNGYAAAVRAALRGGRVERRSRELSAELPALPGAPASRLEDAFALASTDGFVARVGREGTRSPVATANASTLTIWRSP